MRAARLVATLHAEAEESRRRPQLKAIESQTDLTVEELRDSEALAQRLGKSTLEAERAVEEAGLNTEQAELDVKASLRPRFLTCMYWRQTSSRNFQKGCIFWGVSNFPARSSLHHVAAP